LFNLFKKGCEKSSRHKAYTGNNIPETAIITISTISSHFSPSSSLHPKMSPPRQAHARARAANNYPRNSINANDRDTAHQNDSVATQLASTQIRAIPMIVTRPTQTT
jgi:hypothetical protein